VVIRDSVVSLTAVAIKNSFGLFVVVAEKALSILALFSLEQRSMLSEGSRVHPGKETSHGSTTSRSHEIHLPEVGLVTVLTEDS